MLNPVQQFDFGCGPITCHAWNKDRTQIAISPNSNEVLIFSWRQSKWEKSHTLTEHDLPVTGIDWAPNTNRIVTCSQDKNAFVWTFDGKVWKPELVLVRLNRAATCVRWSPMENKFAVGSGAKVISVCYYLKENDWWVSKHIKKPIKSTVTSIDWHPNNILLAVGSCDFKMRVFSALVKEVDEKAGPTPWGKAAKLGDIVAEYSTGGGGWIHCVRFSPSGNRLAWTGHDSSMSVVDACDSSLNDVVPNAKLLRVGCVTSVKDRFLPLTCLEWVTENSIVAAGHDCCPFLFTYSGHNQLKFTSLDVPLEQKTGVITAKNRFRDADIRGQVTENDTTLKTLHQNSITQIAVHSGTREHVAKFSTCGIDGQLILWDLKGLQGQHSSIKVL